MDDICWAKCELQNTDRTTDQNDCTAVETQETDTDKIGFGEGGDYLQNTDQTTDDVDCTAVIFITRLT